MPSLPPEQEPPQGRVERASASLRAAVGADQRTPVRVIVLFLLIVIGLAGAPMPWVVIGLIGAIGLALEWSRARHHP